MPSAPSRTPGSRDAVRGYHVQRAADQRRAGLVCPRPRGPIVTVPGLSWNAARLMQEELYTQFGLDDYVHAVTAEARRRQIPQVFPAEEVSSLRDLLSRWYPLIWARMKPGLVAPVATVQLRSALGYPYNERREDKAEIVSALAERFVRGQTDLDGAFTTINVRLQEEAAGKERQYQFVDTAGRVYAHTMTGEDRMVGTQSGPLLASRTRLVFNLPALNLVKQIFETAVHNWLLSHPVFHHNLYDGATAARVHGYVEAFDIRHMERFTAAGIGVRASTIGGPFLALQTALSACPYLVPADKQVKGNWTDFFLIRPADGWLVQFASGDSAVAPSQKEIFLALYSEFAVTHLRMDEQSAMTWVLQGGDERLTIFNYGDDNLLCGDKELVTSCREFLNQYVAAETEVPTAFLGFNWDERGRRFLLRPRSYLIKLCLNERRPGKYFRRYPYFGWREKRAAYRQYGPQREMSEIFDAEDRLLERLGLPWSEVLERATAEEQTLASEGRDIANLNTATEKDYRLTPEEKIASGDFTRVDDRVVQLVMKHIMES